MIPKWINRFLNAWTNTRHIFWCCRKQIGLFWIIQLITCNLHDHKYYWLGLQVKHDHFILIDSQKCLHIQCMNVILFFGPVMLNNVISSFSVLLGSHTFVLVVLIIQVCLFLRVEGWLLFSWFTSISVCVCVTSSNILDTNSQHKRSFFFHSLIFLRSINLASLIPIRNRTENRILSRWLIALSNTSSDFPANPMERSLLMWHKK